MGAIIEDQLSTVLDLTGVGAYTGGMVQGARAVGILTDALSENAQKQIGMGIAAASASAAIVTALGKAALAAGEEEAVFTRAAGNFKGGFGKDEIAAFAGELQHLTGVGDDVNAKFLGLLGTFQLSADSAKELALPILNAAEALKDQGVSTEQLAVQVGKAIQTGDAAALRRSGIIIDDVGFKSLSAAERVTALAKVLQNQGGDAALAFRNTVPGAIQAATNALGDIEEAAGGPWSGFLVNGANAATKVAESISSLPTGVLQAAGFAAIGVAGGLAIVAYNAGRAVLETGKLATENVRLTNEDLKARKATGGLADEVEREAKAHEHAAKAAGGHADAEGRVHGKGKRGALPASEVGAAVARGAAGKTGGKVAGAVVAEEVAAAETVVGGAAKAGVVAKFGGKLKGGLGGAVAAIVADLALGALPDEGDVGVAKHVAQGAVGGAGTGALIGSFIPGVGNAVGAVVGGAIGAGTAGFGEWQKAQSGAEAAAEKKSAPADPANSLRERQLATLEKMVGILESIDKKDAGPIGLGEVSRAERLREFARAI